MTASAITISLVEGPLNAHALPELHDEGCGAAVVFEGIVRPVEDERRLRALHYQAYEPMTTRELTSLAATILERHGLARLDVQHSVGDVSAGQCSFRLRVLSAHRQEALRAMEAFIDRMKREVPLWKLPVWSES